MFKFLEKLQNSNESSKRRWTVVLSSVSMVVVVLVWFAYFDSLFTGFAEPPPADVEGGGFTFWSTMENGATVIYSGLTERLQGFAGALGEPKEYDINPKN